MDKMKMEIEIGDYLDLKEIKDICIEVVRNNFNEQFKTERDIRRMLSNTAYDIAHQMIDESINEDITDLITSKVKELINKMSSFNVFYKDYFGGSDSIAYKHRQECIKEQFPRIKEIIAENIEEQTLKGVKEDMQDAIYESISQLFKEA